MDNQTDQEMAFHVISADSRNNAVVAQKVSPEHKDEFLEWQRRISREASKFPGYELTELYEPVTAAENMWIAVISFDTHEHLEAWITSPIRRTLVKELRKNFGEFKLSRMGGFDAWFSAVAQDDMKIPDWKMAITVVLALYPTVMLLGYLLTPFLKPLPFPGQMLIGNFASVAILQWFAMPGLISILAFWLRPTRVAGWGVTIAGLAGILAVDALMLYIFLWIG